MYTDPDMAATAKNNIKLIAESVWRQAPDETRHEMGVKYAAFAANAEVARRGAAREFLELVSGLEYLPEDALALELSERIRNLNTAHQGFNNFYTEPAHAKILLLSVPRTGVIPAAVRHEYVKTLTMCRIGNGYGVSRGALSYYDELIERFQEPEIQVFAGLVMDSEVASRLQFQSCASNLRALTTTLRERTANSYTAAALDVILKATPQQLPHLGQATETRRTLTRLLGEAVKR